jgi:hypothetical protein
MAPDNWTHVQGTFPQGRLVRIYVSMTTHTAASKVRADPRAHHYQGHHRRDEKTSFPPLQPATVSLEAKVDTARPGSIVATITLKAGGPGHHHLRSKN